MSSIFFRTVIMFLLLSVSMKLMGKREIGELEVGELITTLLISEICSIPIDNPDIPLLNAVIPVLFIVSVEIIISYLKNKSRKMKRMVDGSAVFIIKDGKINQAALRDNRISLEEFFSAVRQNGTGTLAEIDNCILEANGKISVIKKNEALDRIIISDGEANESLITELGLDKNWLARQLGKAKVSDVFLMTLSTDGNVYILLKEEK